MLAGLSRWKIFRVPPGFCANAELAAPRSDSSKPASMIARIVICTVRPRIAGCRSSEGYHVGSRMIAELEAKRARLAAVERELAALADRHDLAMSEFKFDEAREVQQRIAVLERERAELVDALPAPAPPPPAAPAPAMVRHRRVARRRRRLRR